MIFDNNFNYFILKFFVNMFLFYYNKMILF